MQVETAACQSSWHKPILLDTKIPMYEYCC